MKNKFLIVALCLLCVPPSWGWYRGGGRFGFRGGGGPRVSVGFGGPWWPYPYYGYSDPYWNGYYPYGYGYGYESSYAYDRPEAPSGSGASARLPSKEELRFQYDDGDISKEQYDAGLRQIEESKSQPPRPRQETRTQQEPTPPSASRGESLTAVNDLQTELHVLLDQKLKEGSITKAQHDAEANYLNQLDRRTHALADDNGGRLSAYDEAEMTRKLHGAYYAINHNLVVNP